MIKIQEGELLDLLPSSLKNDTDMICLSYALKMAVGRLLAYERAAMTHNFVDRLSEKILDVLAVELRSPYYLDGMEINVKRGIIKNTLNWHVKAGTARAMSEMIGAVFGDGSIIEWPDFEEPPHTPGTFDIMTDVQMTEDIAELFMTMIERVKNVRSHIRRIKICRDAKQAVYAGACATSVFKPSAIVDGYAESREVVGVAYASIADRAQERPMAVLDGFSLKRRGVGCGFTGGAMAIRERRAAIIDNRGKAAAGVSAANAAISSKRERKENEGGIKDATTI